MKNVYHVQTPENVSLEFELAGAGSRGVAVAIDTAIQGAAALIITLVLYAIMGDLLINLMRMNANSLYVVVGLLLLFVIQFGYFFLFEVFMKGATPGKKIVGLKVMMANGEPVSASASLIRNLIRVGDMFPGMYLVGMISIILNRHYMRIGDLAANTVVVKVQKTRKSFTDKPILSPEHRNLVLSPKEEGLLREYRQRRANPRNPLYSVNLETQLYNHFYNKIGLVPNLPDKFSRRVYLDKLMEYVGIQ